MAAVSQSFMSLLGICMFTIRLYILVLWYVQGIVALQKHHIVSLYKQSIVR